MNRDRKITLTLIGMAVMSSLALIATTTGSLAWYAYSRVVNFSYVGTSVSKSTLLNVGLVDDEHWITDQQLTQYDLERVEAEHSIVFTRSMQGLSVGVIRDYLFKSPNAVDKLFPVTSGSRSINATSDLNLLKSPDYGDTDINLDAGPSTYVVLPFAFKIVGTDGQNVADQKIWLTDATVKADGANIDQAVRIFIKNENSQQSVLMKPADKTTTPGSTKVGGLLDLDGDGTYDYDRSEFYEYFYGEKVGNAELEYETVPYGVPYATAPYDNSFNQTPYTTEPSTFYAKHNQEALLLKTAGVTPKVAEYKSFGQIKPVYENGEYSVGATGF